MTLPRALRPWRQELEAMAPALALSLRPWLHRLHTLVGPLHEQRSHGDGEPDGYNDLHNRGAYERLLMSEWLLADIAPLEFMRRASQGEHLFTRLGRRAPVRRERVVALADAGPEQLGLPRLAQLAALLVLHGRARDGHASFLWGVLHRPGLLESGFAGEAAVRRFLAARHSAPNTHAALDKWTIAIDELGLEPDDELWLLGGETGELPGELHRATHLQIHESLSGDTPRQIELRLRVRGGPERRGSLHAPDDKTCAQLLRDPFQRAVRTRSGDALAAGTEVLLSWNGTRLFARQGSGTVAAWHVPGTPNEPPGRTRYLVPPEGGSIVAVGYNRGFVGVASLADGTLATWERGVWQPTTTSDADTGRLWLEGAWAVDKNGTVLATSRFCRRDVAHPTGRRKTPWTFWRAVHDRQTPITLGSNEPEQVEDNRLRLPIAVDVDETFEAFMSLRPTPAMAVAGLHHGWLLISPLAHDGARVLQLYPPKEASVIGVTWYSGQNCLVLLDPNRRSVSLVGVRCSTLLFSTPDPVASAHVSSTGRVACKTVAGDILVYCPRYGDLVLRRSGAAE